MPLDPQVEKILYWAQRAATPSFAEIGAEAARALYERTVLTLDIAPRPMHEVQDHQVALAGRRIRIRQYSPTPHGWAQPMPALLYFHGGGFTIGSVDTHDRVCRMLAADADCLVFSVDYRLAPEHPFPAAVDDAFDSLLWLRAEAGALGVDLERIAVGGDSAGGTLAAATAIHARDLGLPLALQLLVYPGTAGGQGTESHRRLARGYLLDAEVIRWFFGNYVRSPAERDDWRFAPLNAPSLARLAPAWIALAEFDPLVDEGLDYAERLRTAGVPVDCTVYEGMIHAFFQHAGFVVRARQAHADACAALRAAFAEPAIPTGD
ncbi:alpha/beta hydrolase [Quisquiliibacterium transsilvanicum]|uniref:Acetyl esterase n=1 Tax=Quisquiliibacterium transsilvanicum TaxID=1549638 RepID=A0A7W8HEC3_9BURK|nr:alpha/beta hydrolase [Quisquiliibacterium transsilvanicum]MBB5270406.1 acetyl esterase [Quisquiliibacterium transsilvanicum]